MADDDLCIYCGEPVLTGAEDPEHAVPAAINGRLITTAVCVPCNRQAGKEIDQPWLNDPFVLDTRFTDRIPDRRGNLVAASPMLTGMTADGRRVTMGHDGVPRQLNQPVTHDPATGMTTISASDQASLDAQIEKQKRKAQAAGKSFTPGHHQSASDHARIEVTLEIAPGVWRRMAAKIALALLGEQQPAAWRRSASAELLRTEMKQAASDVELTAPPAIDTFAARPATAVVLSRALPGPRIIVSLMGVFTSAFQLADDLDRTDWAWVSDPIDPRRNADGSLGVVIYARHKALGYLDDADASDGNG